MDRDGYIKNLEMVISKFLEPLKDVPFAIVVKATTGCKLLKFDKNCRHDAGLLRRLQQAMDTAIQTAYAEGIQKTRPNEVGNAIEPFVKTALDSVGLAASTPLTADGKSQSAGYPDILITEKGERMTYLECKTYNAKNAGSSFRTFYYQPSQKSKIIHDARHLMVSFEITREARNGVTVFVPVRWKIYTLENMLVQIKHEFNTSNKMMYQDSALLAEGGVE